LLAAGATFDNNIIIIVISTLVIVVTAGGVRHFAAACNQRRLANLPRWSLVSSDVPLDSSITGQ
jgi:hypothetical protein